MQHIIETNSVLSNFCNELRHIGVTQNFLYKLLFLYTDIINWNFQSKLSRAQSRAGKLHLFIHLPNVRFHCCYTGIPTLQFLSYHKRICFMITIFSLESVYKPFEDLERVPLSSFANLVRNFMASSAKLIFPDTSKTNYSVFTTSASHSCATKEISCCKQAVSECVNSTLSTTLASSFFLFRWYLITHIRQHNSLYLKSHNLLANKLSLF